MIKLNKIYRYYQRKFKLKTELVFSDSSEGCYFMSFPNHIAFNVSYIIKYLKKIKIKTGLSSINDNLIFILLHEIGHAVDSKYHWRRWNKECSMLNEQKYHNNESYYLSRPFEIRANKFATREVKRWI